MPEDGFLQAGREWSARYDTRVAAMNAWLAAVGGAPVPPFAVATWDQLAGEYPQAVESTIESLGQYWLGEAIHTNQASASAASATAQTTSSWDSASAAPAFRQRMDELRTVFGGLASTQAGIASGVFEFATIVGDAKDAFQQRAQRMFVDFAEGLAAAPATRGLSLLAAAAAGDQAVAEVRQRMAQFRAQIAGVEFENQLVDPAGPGAAGPPNLPHPPFVPIPPLGPTPGLPSPPTLPPLVRQLWDGLSGPGKAAIRWTSGDGRTSISVLHLRGQERTAGASFQADLVAAEHRFPERELFGLPITTTSSVQLGPQASVGWHATGQGADFGAGGSIVRGGFTVGIPGRERPLLNVQTALGGGPTIKGGRLPDGMYSIPGPPGSLQYELSYDPDAVREVWDRAVDHLVDTGPVSRFVDGMHDLGDAMKEVQAESYQAYRESLEALREGGEILREDFVQARDRADRFIDGARPGG